MVISKPLIPITILAIVFLYEEWVSFPSCKHILPDTTRTQQNFHHRQNGVVFGDESTTATTTTKDLKVMLVSDLLLSGSDDYSLGVGLFNLYFRDYFLSKFFKKSFHALKPDMLIVMGDISARASALTRTKWLKIRARFDQMLGPFLELPFHVVLGDRDVGECNGLDAKSVFWLARNFQGLDSAGCASFEIGNVSFISLNAVSLLCGNNQLRFSVEKVIEAESVDLRMEPEGNLKAFHDGFRWRENSVASQSGSVLLLHFPLHRSTSDNCEEVDGFTKAMNPSLKSLSLLRNREIIHPGPYQLAQKVPVNATEYIFQALKPRIVFSAHSHKFCDYTHSDGTREITVPAMTWKARDDPGFIVAGFWGDGVNFVSISYCALARESCVAVVYASLSVMLITAWSMANVPHVRCSRE